LFFNNRFRLSERKEGLRVLYLFLVPQQKRVGLLSFLFYYSFTIFVVDVRVSNSLLSFSTTLVALFHFLVEKKNPIIKKP